MRYLLNYFSWRVYHSTVHCCFQVFYQNWNSATVDESGNWGFQFLSICFYVHLIWNLSWNITILFTFNWMLLYLGVTVNQALGVNRRLSIPNLAGSSKLTDHKALSRTVSASKSVGSSSSPAAGAVGGGFSAFVYPPATPSTSGANLPDANETDEHKVNKLPIVI